MINLKYRISTSICDTLEALQYELSGLSNALVHLIRSHPNDPNVCTSDTFLKYENSYMEKYTEYNLATNMISEMIPEKLQKYVIDWVIEFELRVLEIRFREEILNDYTWEEILCEMQTIDIVGD